MFGLEQYGFDIVLMGLIGEGYYRLSTNRAAYHVQPWKKLMGEVAMAAQKLKYMNKLGFTVVK